MNRQTQREIDRLNKLADFIEANPKEYNQGDKERCIVGLGLRLNTGKLQAFDNFIYDNNEYREVFSNKFGVSNQTVDNLFVARFGKINPKARNQDTFGGVSARSAVSILRYIAKQKTLDKVV